eukprot:657706-Amphidinium_carterae.1
MVCVLVLCCPSPIVAALSGEVGKDALKRRSTKGHINKKNPSEFNSLRRKESFTMPTGDKLAKRTPQGGISADWLYSSDIEMLTS